MALTAPRQPLQPQDPVIQPESSSPAPVLPSRSCLQLTTALPSPPMGFAELGCQPILASSHHHPLGGAHSWGWGQLLVFPDVLLMAGQGWDRAASWRSLWRATESLRCCSKALEWAMQMLSVAGFSFYVAPSLCWYLFVCIYSLTVWWTELYLPKAKEKNVFMWRKLFQSLGFKHASFEENFFFMDFLNHNKESMLRICYLDERLMQTDFWTATKKYFKTSSILLQSPEDLPGLWQFNVAVLVIPNTSCEQHL